MKKILVGLLAFLFVFSMTACVSSGETTAEVDAAPESGVIFSGDVELNPITIVENHQYAKNYQFAGVILPGDYKAQAGDVITLHMEGTVDNGLVLGPDDKGIDTVLVMYPVDTTQAASWWTPLVSEDKYVRTTEEIAAGGSFSFDMTFTLEKNATGKASGGAVNLCIGTGNNQAETVNMTTTSFTYEITR